MGVCLVGLAALSVWGVVLVLVYDEFRLVWGLLGVCLKLVWGRFRVGWAVVGFRLSSVGLG